MMCTTDVAYAAHYNIQFSILDHSEPYNLEILLALMYRSVLIVSFAIVFWCYLIYIAPIKYHEMPVTFSLSMYGTYIENKGKIMRTIRLRSINER
jgi:hypothetical protein